MHLVTKIVLPGFLPEQLRLGFPHGDPNLADFLHLRELAEGVDEDRNAFQLSELLAAGLALSSGRGRRHAGAKTGGGNNYHYFHRGQQYTRQGGELSNAMSGRLRFLDFKAIFENGIAPKAVSHLVYPIYRGVILRRSDGGSDRRRFCVCWGGRSGAEGSAFWRMSKSISFASHPNKPTTGLSGTPATTPTTAKTAVVGDPGSLRMTLRSHRIYLFGNCRKTEKAQETGPFLFIEILSF